jgi:hypothetical protein
MSSGSKRRESELNKDLRGSVMGKSYNDGSQYKNTVRSNESKKRDTLYAGFDKEPNSRIKVK